MNKLSIFALAALVSVAACQSNDDAAVTDEAVIEAPAADATAPELEPLPETVDTTVAAPETDPMAAPVTEPAAEPQH